MGQGDIGYDKPQQGQHRASLFYREACMSGGSQPRYSLSVRSGRGGPARLQDDTPWMVFRKAQIRCR